MFFFFPVTRQLYGCLSRIFSRSYNLRLLVNLLFFFTTVQYDFFFFCVCVTYIHPFVDAFLHPCDVFFFFYCGAEYSLLQETQRHQYTHIQKRTFNGTQKQVTVRPAATMRRALLSLSTLSCCSAQLSLCRAALAISCPRYSTPGKIKVNITVQDGTQLDFSTPTGITLMEAIRDVAQLDMDVSCQKKMRCSICHVYLCDGWYEKIPPPSEEELDTLDQAYHPQDNSRLSCQVRLTPLEDGIVVVLPKHKVDLTMK